MPRPTPSPAPMELRTRLTATAVRASSALARRLGRGGSVIGGHVGLRLQPRAVAALAAGRWIATVSATNGKTTTNRFLAEALATLGPVATNGQGSNLRTGLVTALALDTRSPRAALEVDEATLAVVAAELRPAVMVLSNLSRDQLDRYGEVRIIAGRWRRMLEGLPTATAAGDVAPDTVAAAGAGHVVANADDPLVVWAVEPARSVTWVAAGAAWTADAAVCPACGAAVEHGVGAWRCTGCDLRRPEPHYRLEGDELVTPEGGRHAVSLGLPGRFNVGNAAMAAAAARHAGVPVDRALGAMAHTTEVAGRYRTVLVHGRRARLLMAKNPAGWKETLGLLEPGTPVVVGINARVADGRDPSWLWDVPFEALRGRPVVATGDRAHDLAVRLHYAGVDHTVHTHDDGPLLDALRRLPEGTVDVLLNYTAFADALEEVGR